MAGLELIEPTELYNLLNQGTKFPSLSNPNYLLLLDARKKNEYNESHVITAKKAPKNEEEEFVVPYDAELECKTHVIMYDGNTNSLKDEGEAIKCGQLMWDMSSRNPVKILKGGYEAFSALYPFLRTQKILYMPREYDEISTYPAEIIPNFLYLGTLAQANTASIQKDLKVRGHINCSEEPETFFKEEGPHLMHIPVSDSPESDLKSKFRSACEFIDGYKDKDGVMLVFSDLGISRSVTIIIAYLMYDKAWSLQTAYDHVLQCCHNMRPNTGFMAQLTEWERELTGSDAQASEQTGSDAQASEQTGSDAQASEQTEQNTNPDQETNQQMSSG